MFTGCFVFYLCQLYRCLLNTFFKFFETSNDTARLSVPIELQTKPRAYSIEDELQDAKIFGFREARLTLADNELYMQTVQIGHQLFLSLSDLESQNLLKSKVKDLMKNLSKEHRTYRLNRAFSAQSTGLAQTNDIVLPSSSQTKDKLKSLATLYLVHLNAMDELSTYRDIVMSVLDDILLRVCANTSSSNSKNSNNTLKSADYLNASGGSGGAKSKFLSNVGKLVNRHGNVVNAYSRYKDKMLSKVWPSAAPSIAATPVAGHNHTSSYSLPAITATPYSSTTVSTNNDNNATLSRRVSQLRRTNNENATTDESDK
ncbi:hypothetical protein GJ496_010179 [Pomphorhynchus laevis]|nr:hypothetical protein GJ496_010179 [Pomphorhynchus laevis]